MTLIETYGLPTWNDTEWMPARVTAVHRDRFEIVTEMGFSHAQMKRGLHAMEMPTVGDLIAVEYNPSGDSKAVDILPRRTLFARQDSWHGTRQLIAANVDLTFITTSVNADFNLRRLERYLALARESGSEPIFLLTKCDLIDAEALEQLCAQVSQLAPDCTVLTLSVFTGQGMEELRALLTPGRIAVLLGSSGVGKSSLVNVLMGDAVMKTNTIRPDDDKGRHTTVHRQLLELPGGALLIDTPGMRELGMWDAHEGVASVFSDVEAFVSRCRFSDCTHTHEPGCALRAAIEAGTLDEARVKNYLKMKNEADKTARRAQKAAKMKEISKFSRARKKEGR